MDSEIVLASAPLEVSAVLLPEEAHAPVPSVIAVTAAMTVNLASLIG
jgi:hypothetical protein